MKNIFSDKRGTIVVISAIAITALLACAALALDGGYLYFKHTKFQDLADTAALSAAIEIANGKSNLSLSKKKENGFIEAKNCATENELQVKDVLGKDYTALVTTGANEKGTMIVSYPDPTGLNKVKVEIQVDANAFLSKVFGNYFSPLKVSATAKIGQAMEHSGQLMPLSFFWDKYECGQLYELSLAPGDGGGEGVSGNYGYLNYPDPETGDENGAADFDDNMMYGFDGTLKVGQTVPTNPGVTAGIVDAGIIYRIDYCKANHVTECVYQSGAYEEDCPRVVVIPIIKGFFEGAGKSYVTIGGFAKFFIVGYDKNSKILSGYFINAIKDVPEIDGDASKYMVNGVKLLE